jgi:RNA polymerase sigma factor (sigma-70 family)
MNEHDLPPDRLGSTNWSAIRQGDLEYLARRYWKPLYRFLRPRLPQHEEAEEATQEFFLRFIERDVLHRLDPGKGRLRGLLFTMARQFLVDRLRAQGAAKRGGEMTRVPVSDIVEIAPDCENDPQRDFDRRWFQSLVNRVRRAVKAHFHGKDQPLAYRAFRLFYFGTPDRTEWTQKRIADELGITQDMVNNYLYRGRQVYAEAVRSLVAEYAGQDGVEEELQELTRFLDGGGLEAPPSQILVRPAPRSPGCSSPP